MRKIRFLNIFPVLLALVLFFPGCKNGSIPETPPATNTKNGFLFWGKSANKYIFLSIYQETTPVKLNSPKKGESWFYAVVVVTFDGEGDPNSWTVTSKGTITVGDDDKLNFKADEGSVTPPQTAIGTLALADRTLHMKGVPGAIYPDILMDIDMEITATPQKPFGLEPSDFTKPDIPPSTNPPSTDPDNPISPNAEKYNAGKIATRIEIKRPPEWGLPPSSDLEDLNIIIASATNPVKVNANKRNMFFEGDRVVFGGTNIEVRIDFSDGTWEPVTADNIYNWFVVEPPDFKLEQAYASTVNANRAGVGQTSLLGSAFKYGQISATDTTTPQEYTLYLKDGFGNSSILPSTLSSTLLSPTPTWQLSATFKGPKNGNIFPIKEITYNYGNSSLREWLEDEIRVFPRDKVLDVNNNEVSVKVAWWGYNKDHTIAHIPPSAGGTSIPSGSFSADWEGRDTNFHTREPYSFKLSERDLQLNEVNIQGSVTVDNPVTLNVAIGTWSVPLSASAYHKVDKIVSSKEISGTNQIIFDDPRLYSSIPNDPAINLHWLDKLNGGKIRVSYVGTNTTRERTIQEAFNNAGIGFIRYNSGPFTSARGSVALNYYQTQILGYEVPVFSNLVGIMIKNITGLPYPVLKATNGDNQEKYLKNMVEVLAYYEKGKDGPQVVREDTYKNARLFVDTGDNGTKPNENRSSIGTFDSNIDSSRVKATNNYKKVPAEPTTVRLYFNIGSVKKYRDTQIGAVDYK
jgi:hypothetical protein